MSDETTAPALTPAQWEKRRLEWDGDRHSRYALLSYADPGHPEQAPVVYLHHNGMGGPVPAKAVAALCLYGQPGGLTAADVAWLRRMSFTSLSRDEAEQHQEWWQSFLARLAALLPQP